MTTEKSFLDSRTMKFNFIIALLMVLESQLALLEPYLSREAYILLLLVVPAINLYLRATTNTAITFRLGRSE